MLDHMPTDLCAVYRVGHESRIRQHLQVHFSVMEHSYGSPWDRAGQSITKAITPFLQSSIISDRILLMAEPRSSWTSCLRQAKSRAQIAWTGFSRAIGLNSLAVGPHSTQDQLAYNYSKEEDERGNMSGVE